MKVLIWSILSGAKIVLFLIIDGLDARNLTDLLRLPIFIVRLVKGVKKMARYIDTDNVKLKGICVFDQNLEILVPLSDVRKALQMTPTADAVEIVRCKDCIHRDPEDKKCDGTFQAKCGMFQMDDNDFCSYGERRKEDGNV